MQKKATTEGETEVRPQWLTVKEEIIYSVYDLSELLAAHLEYPGDREIRHEWLKVLRSHYLKYMAEIQKHNADLCSEIERFLRQPSKFNLPDCQDMTLKLIRATHESKITDVSNKTEPFGPGEAIKRKFSQY